MVPELVEGLNMATHRRWEVSLKTWMSRRDRRRVAALVHPWTLRHWYILYGRYIRREG
jgi:hypothetical protein